MQKSQAFELATAVIIRLRTSFFFLSKNIHNFVREGGPRQFILKFEHDLKAFWPFFYIWFGFLCAQVSSGNCETMPKMHLSLKAKLPFIYILVL